MTDYKVQGKTLDYFVLCVGPRKGMRPPLTMTDFYVLVSRVRSGQRLYVIGFDPAEAGDHLRQLKHSPVLAIWRAGYGEDGGPWNCTRAARFAVVLATQKAAESAARRRRACSARAAKRAADGCHDAAPTAKRCHAPKTAATRPNGSTAPKRKQSS